MRFSFTSVATIGALLLFSSTRAMAQHGGHGGGGHSPGQHGSGRGAHAGSSHQPPSSRPPSRVATPRVTAHPPIATHGSLIAPAHQPHHSCGRYSAVSDGYGRVGPNARLRILDAPRNAGVIVDGEYVGVVDDFDGVFQRLELTAGIHHIEIRTPGSAAIAFDVNTRGRRTITYRAQMIPAQP